MGIASKRNFNKSEQAVKIIKISLFRFNYYVAE